MLINVLLAVVVVGDVDGSAAAAMVGPNIVLIVSDDQGYRDLGCFGSDQVLTPRLDRLAREGVRLTSFYVTWPACTPSRGSLLTGRYPQRNGTYDMIRNEAPDHGVQYTAADYAVTFERIGGMDVREVLLPQLLSSAGYLSAVFGKWDLGIQRRYLPLARGFDQFYGFVNTGIDYFTHERYGVPSMYRDNAPTTEDRGTYCTHLFRREALRFLHEWKATGQSRPFLLYLPFNAPHGASNLDPRIRGAAQATAADRSRYPHLRLGYRQGVRYGRPAEIPTRQHARLEYLAAVSAMDDAIGAVLDALQEIGAADNTLVIFLSDNGGSGDADNGPLRGRKAWLFEGGIRVPCIVRYPDHIPAGSQSDAFLSSLEIVPTLLAAAGVTPPDELTLDGFDMMPILTQQSESARTEMYWQRRDDRAARIGDWKWVQSANGSGLFDLSQDVGEQRDLSDRYPDRLRQLQAGFARWRRAMDEAEPRGPFRDY